MTEFELFDAAWEECKRDARVRGWEPRIPDFRAGWNALAGLLGNEHYAVYTENGWTTEHSLECRLGGDMAHCRYHELAGTVDPPELGRYLIREHGECSVVLESVDA